MSMPDLTVCLEFPSVFDLMLRFASFSIPGLMFCFASSSRDDSDLPVEAAAALFCFPLLLPPFDRSGSVREAAADARVVDLAARGIVLNCMQKLGRICSAIFKRDAILLLIKLPARRRVIASRSRTLYLRTPRSVFTRRRARENAPVGNPPIAIGEKG